MSKDKAEEKAREYAIKKHGDELIFHESYLETLGDFKAGYTQAITDLSTENVQLREALREMVDTQFNSDMSHFNAMQKAKQLLTDNTQDNEKH